MGEERSVDVKGTGCRQDQRAKGERGASLSVDM